MNQEKLTNKIELLLRRNSFLAALVITYNILCAVLQQALQLDISYGNMLGAVIIILILVTILFNGRIILSQKILFLCIYIIMAIFLSGFLTGIKTNDYIISFFFFGVIGCYAGMQKINTELVLRYLVYLSFLPILFINGLIEVHFRETSTSMRMDMGISYALLPMVLAAMLHFLYYRNKSNFILKTGYLINAILMIYLLIIGTRGGLLSLFIFFMFIYSNQYKKYKDRKEHTLNKRRTWIVWLSICAGVIAIIFYNQIMLATSNFFSGLGLHINVFDKTTMLINSTGDGTNGRIILWKAAAEGILKSPIWGYGWGSFFKLTGHTHPHNIFLELMYQGGLFITIPILFPIFGGVYKCATGQIENIDDFAYAILLISSCLPRLMVSASLWNIQIFWMLLAFMVVHNSTKMRTRMLSIKEAL